IQADNDPRDFLADIGGAEDEDEMENEFGGAGNYNQDLQSMLQDILAHMMGRASGAGNAAGAESEARAAPSGPGDAQPSDAASHDAAMPGGLPSDNIFVRAGESGDQGPSQSSSSSAGSQRIPGMRTWTSNIGGHQMSFSVASLSSDDVVNMASAAQRRADGSEGGDRGSQTNSEESQRRPMFIDPEENAPLNIGSLMTSILSALGGAGRGDGGGNGGAGAIFGVPIGNLGDYVWGQNSFDDVITRIMEQNPTAHAPPPASEEQISKLPKRPITDEEVAAHKECGICMEEYQANEQVLELPCGHFYHNECIDHWLKVNGTCPICRKRIDSDEAADGQPSAPPHVREHSELPGSFPSSPSEPPAPSAHEQQQQRSGTGASTTASASAPAVQEPPEPESEPLD
ncbi:hypothetical protein LPJ56_003999, partial [Coemansia sp. RSA 2599]